MIDDAGGDGEAVCDVVVYEVIGGVVVDLTYAGGYSFRGAVIGLAVEVIADRIGVTGLVGGIEGGADGAGAGDVDEL